MRITNLVATVVLVFMAANPSFTADPVDGEHVGLTLLITSGTSGRLFGQDGLTVASLAATIKTTAEKARADGRSVVILDAGRTVLPYAESRFDGGAAMVEVLNSAGCSVFAPAPIDFAIGMKKVRSLAANAPFAVLRPFDIEGDTDIGLRDTAEVVTDQGLVLEVVSLMNPVYADELASAGIGGAVAFEPPVDDPAPNRLRLAVVHSRGHGNNLANRSMTWNLVRSPDGIDVLYDPDLGADVVMRSVSEEHPVVLAGRNQDHGRPWTVARLDLEVERIDGSWGVSAADLEVIGVDAGLRQDAELLAELDSARERFQIAQNQELPDGVPSTRDELAQFVLKALRERARTEVAILNRGALRPVANEHFHGGRLTREIIVRLLSFDQYLVEGSLSGADLEALATESVQRVGHDGSPRMDSLLFEGVTFEIVDQGTPSASVKNLQVNDRPVRLKDEYSVATNLFLASGGDEYPILSWMAPEWLYGDPDDPLELRSDVVLPRIEQVDRDFVDLNKRALWHWGVDRASLGFYTVKADRDSAYDGVSDSRARAYDSTAFLAEVRAYTEREKPTWTWENLLWGRYGVLDVEGAERRETDDHLRLETSAVFTRATILGGGHPYASFNVETEFKPAKDSDGENLSRRFEQSLAAGIDWSASLWPRIRVGVTTRNYSHIDRDPQIGMIAEAFFKRGAKDGWPGIDAHILGEYLVGDDSDLSRFDLDIRLPFPVYRALELTPAFNYYVYNDSALPGNSQYLRISLNLSYSWAGKHQSW